MNFSILFLGCKVNSYESEAVANSLIKHGYKEVKIDENPDVIIVNTCAVTETSSSKSRKLVRRYRKKYSNAIMIVMGCYAQYDGANLIKEGLVDIALGTSYRNKIYEQIEKFKANKKPICLLKEPRKLKEYEEISLEKYFEKTRAYVKVQDGCDNFCTYCLIPYVRGKSRSRNKDEILSEIKTLIENDYKEIIITGIDQGSYGEDFAIKDTFSNLLKDILEKNPDLYRLRISSLEESQVDDLFLELLKKYDNVANHLHLPLQSGSSNVLKRMNRKYNLNDFKETVRKIREIRPDIAITTDVIVGFPGETEEDFEETCNFIKEIRFAKVHVFPYSDRSGTIASKYKDKVPEIDKKLRVLKLIKISDELEEEYESQFFGKDIEFLFESYDKKLKAYKGHSSNFLECIYESKEDIKDKILTVKFDKKHSKYANLLNFDIVKK